MYWLPPQGVPPSALTRMAAGAGPPSGLSRSASHSTSSITTRPASLIRSWLPSWFFTQQRHGEERRGGVGSPGGDLDDGDRFLWVRGHPTQQREADLQAREGL